MGSSTTAVREQLAQYLESFSGRGEKLAGFDAMVSALRRLGDLTDDLYEPRGGEYVPFTRESYAAVTEAYAAASAACRTYLDTAAPGDAPAREVARLLAQDQKLLAAISVDEDAYPPLSLPQAVELARGRTVDLTGASLSTRGGALSSRIPMSITDAGGRTVEGFFTAETRIAPAETYRRALDEFIRALSTGDLGISPIGVRNVNDVHPAEARMQLLEKLREFNTRENIAALLVPGEDGTPAFIDQNKRLREAPTQGDSLWRCFGLDDDDLACLYSLRAYSDRFGPMEKAFSDKVYGVHLQKSLYGGALGVAPDANIDRRNCAMSVVANMLGAPELVAASVPMTAVDGQTVTRGVFMANAKGEPCGNLPYDHPIGHRASEDFLTVQAMKDIAGLQVLDYICMNIDRHRGNLFFRFDDSGRICGVQGIDNDCSFGIRPLEVGKRSHMLPALRDITAVPESVGRAIQGMTEEMLRTNLRGSLTDAEITAACKRLSDLQARLVRPEQLPQREDGTIELQRGAICMLSDAEWERIDPEKLCGLDNGSNSENRYLDQRSAANYFERISGMPEHVRLGDRFRREKAARGRMNQQEWDALPDKTRTARLTSSHEHLKEQAAARELEKVVNGPDYPKAQAIHPIEGANLSGDKEAVRQLSRTLRSSENLFVGGHKEYQTLRTKLGAFRERRRLTAENAEDYLRQLRELGKAADAYLAYKTDPQKPREIIRVQVARDTKAFAERRIAEIMALRDIRPLMEEVHAREVSAVLTSANAQARTIDRIAARTQSHMEDNAPIEGEEYLAAYGKMSEEALSTLISLSAEDSLRPEQQQTARKAIAVLTVAELAEQEYVREGAGPIAARSRDEKSRTQLTESFGKLSTFQYLTHGLTPKRLQSLTADPNGIRRFAKQAAKFREAQQPTAPAAQKQNVHKLP